MLDQLEGDYPAEVALFVISPRAQGLGIGSQLYQRFLKSLKERDVQRYYLFTDTSCNYKFYELKGLKRSCTREYNPQTANHLSLDLYLYTGTVPT